MVGATTVPEEAWAPCIWFCGLSGAGKTTMANLLFRSLTQKKIQAFVLDGDVLRFGLCSDLKFSPEDRKENLRRIRELARILAMGGIIPIVACISPFAADRELARNLFPQGRFGLVFMDTAMEECCRRDPKGLYKKVKQGLIPDFTGVSSPFEAPADAEVIIKNWVMTNREQPLC